MSLTMTYRGLSIGAWLMLVGAVVGILSVILVTVLAISTGGTLLTTTPDLERPLVLIFLVVGALVAFLAVLLVLIGLTIYVVGPSFSSDSARKDYASHRTVLASLLLAIALAGILQVIYLLIVGMSAASDRSSPTMMAVLIASLEFSLLLVVWIRIIRPRAITWAEMGLTTDRLGQKLLAGVGTGVVILVVAYIIEFVLTRLGVEQTQARMLASVKSAAPLQFAALLLAVAVLAPFVEEVFFRGYVFKAYLERKGVVQAYVLSALVFALAHVSTLEVIPPAFVIGLILAYVFRMTGSIVPTMVAHMMNNSIALIAIYLGIS